MPLFAVAWYIGIMVVPHYKRKLFRKVSIWKGDTNEKLLG
jgi:hypothetical protein